MKREVKDYKIKAIHPHFFWTKCNVCGNEFKKENMWRIEYRNHTVDICKHCAPTYENVVMYAKNDTTVPLPLRSSKDVPPAKTNRIPPPPPQPRPLRKPHEGYRPKR